MKPGIKTSELYITILAVASPIILVLTGVEIGEHQELAAAIAALVTAVTYVAGRTWLKIVKK